MATELEELQTLNLKLAEFLTYVQDRDTAAAAAATAAAEQAAIDKAAADAAAADKAAADAAAATATATAESEFRSDVIESINALQEEPVTQIDYTNLLTEIKTAIQPNEDTNQVEYFADLSVIFLVVIVLPILFVYKVYRYVFDMLVRAF